MTEHHLFKYHLISALVLLTVLGVTQVSPFIARAQSLTVNNVISEQVHAPFAARYYVSKTGNSSDGSSWSNAFTNLQDALSAASSGDEIWVAAGIYTPGTNEADSFNLVPGVSVYGGFKEGDKRLSDRDWEGNVTILSGDIHGDDITDASGVVNNVLDIFGDNSYHVVFADGTTGTPITSKTVLDGFTITAGQADGTNEPYNRGGGFYCDGSGENNACSPNPKNVTFSGNIAQAGGGMYNDARNEGTSSPNLSKVTFTGNSADYGGAMNINVEFGISSPILLEVTFTGNHAKNSGGAMLNYSFDSTCKPSLTKVNFSDNSAGETGGAMYNLALHGTSSPNLKDVVFSSNSATESGGAMFNKGGGGGIISPVITNVTFTGNSSSNKGGAIYNTVNDDGESSPIIKNTTFSGNWADGYGGAMYNNGYGDGTKGTSSPSLTNVTFSGNSADYGGAMFNDGTRDGESSPILTNVTLSGNSAEVYGGAMSNSGRLGTCLPDVRNSILWNNQDSSGTGTISANIHNSSAATTLSHSLVEASGGSGGNWVAGSYVDSGGNIDKEPQFMTPLVPSSAPTTAGNLRLQISSPAIEAGDNTHVTGVPTDLDGNPRIADGDLDGIRTVDMGAFESPIYEKYLALIFR